MYLEISNPMEYHVALYIRLSKEDENEGPSESVNNQQSLLNEFAQQRRLSVYDTYVDDGYSGTTFDRPSFQRMIADIEAKKVNMVITKDLSRLGRDYILTGHYMERYFPEHRVRYISLLDGIDTGVDSTANDITPFRAIMNDMYALVYTPGRRMAFHIPAPEQRSNYSPKSFAGNCHLIRARAARPEEISARRNMAFNPYDAGRETGCFPHTTSSVEAQDVSFAARNAVDGIFENNSHGGWPYQAWGINKDPNATLKVDFGRSVTIDELRLTLRADFPHDSWWTSATVQFGDGTQEVLTLERTGKPQSFPIAPRTIEWLELRELKKSKDISEFPALTQLEVFGTETE